MGSHVALVKGNRQMGFQVDRATHIFFSFGLMRSPDGISCWFWLKGIAGRDLRLAQPHTILVLVKGDRRTGSQVNPTTQILVLVQGDRPMGSQDKTGKKKKRFSLQSLLCKTLRSFAS